MPYPTRSLQHWTRWRGGAPPLPLPVVPPSPPPTIWCPPSSSFQKVPSEQNTCACLRSMQHAEVQAQRHALEVEAQTQRAVANKQSQTSEFALHAQDAVLQANREIDMLRQLLQPRDQTIDRLTRENTRMQANNGADHTPAASRPPLLPSPTASGHSPSQASPVESQGSVASELRNEMREELRKSRDRMHEAVVTMTQQVREPMQTMQQQINVLTAQIARYR